MGKGHFPALNARIDMSDEPRHVGCGIHGNLSLGARTQMLEAPFQIVSAAVTLPSKMRKRKTNLGRQGGANLRHPSPTSTAPCPKSVWIHVQLPAAYKLPSRGSRRVTG
ncbi:hypothetical protein HDV62DRAFT_372430 [Trichoderma sp. SZMC 28011]